MKYQIENNEIRYLNRQDISNSGIYDFECHMKSIEDVYHTHFEGDFIIPMTEYLKYKDRPTYDRIVVLLGYLGGRFNVSGIKEIASSTSNFKKGFERASGIIILNDPDTQRPYAIMEGAQISAVRTVAVSSVAIKYFAPDNMNKVSIIGCGYLAKIHLKMLKQLYFDRIGELCVFDNDESKRVEFCDDAKELGFKIKQATSAEQCIRESDVILPCTTSEEPYIESAWIKQGSLYCAVSLLDPKLNVLEDSDYIIVDDEKNCKHEGRPLQLLEKNGRLDSSKLFSIGEILSKKIDIRSDKKAKIFFNPMGLILMDLALAARCYEIAIEKGIGIQLDI